MATEILSLWRLINIQSGGIIGSRRVGNGYLPNRETVGSASAAASRHRVIENMLAG